MRSLLAVKVQPRSSQVKVEVLSDGSVKIWTTAAPTDGQANEAVCQILAKKIGIAKSKVSVIKGRTSRSKTIEVLDLEPATLQDRLQKNTSL